MKRVYLDHNATTPLHPRVIAEMARVMEAVHGNPSSIHREGVGARYVVEKARRTILRAINARKEDHLVFTGSATEADNLALRGVIEAFRRNGGAMPRLLLPPTEHKAVLAPAALLREQGFCRDGYLPVDGWGRVEWDRVEDPGGGVDLLSIGLANSELGTLATTEDTTQARNRFRGAILHTDAAQGLGRVPVDVQALGVDLATFNAHKSGGPKGVGALYIRGGVALEPLVLGGGQEEGLRAGTEDPAAIAGFAEAVKVSLEEMPSESGRLRHLRELCWTELSGRLGPSVVRNSPEEACLPGTLNFSVPGRDGRALVRELDARGFAVSAGSACSSGGEAEVSHVLRAVGMDEGRARGALRLSLGRGNVEEDMAALAAALEAILRSPGP